MLPLGLEAKMLEIRDRATFIPVLAVEIGSVHAQTRFLIRRIAWDRVNVILIRDGGMIAYEPSDWPSVSFGRTMTIAHQYIADHWVELRSGDVVDVEYILGETNTPKRSEFYDI